MAEIGNGIHSLSTAAAVAPPSRKARNGNGNGQGTAKAPGRVKARKGLAMQRRFTTPGIHPFDEIEWDLRSAVISDENDKVIFEQKDVEIPKAWSQLATNVVVSKYFRGQVGTIFREHSAKQLVGRVADTLAKWGLEGDYFASTADAETFRAELAHLLLHQKCAFNSPVWFNLGVEPKPQCSACFIQSVKDEMASIMDLAKSEVMLFKYGSGTGSNLSNLRSSKENLSGGGIASGPLSFMKGYDAFAGAIKSGGKTRRAAKMVILDADHPDVIPFITSKSEEEKKAWALIEAGYAAGFNVPGGAYDSIAFQNANHSVRVSDEFMQAVIEDRDWWTRYVVGGQPADKHRARDLMRHIAEATWICGDPGMQFDTTINDWHPCAGSDRIYASNPCFTGDALVLTDRGFIRFRDLLTRANEGEEFRVATDNRTSGGAGVQFTSPLQYMITGFNPVTLLTFSNGMAVRCTPKHRFFTANRGMVHADELTADDRVVVQTQAVEFTRASGEFPVPADFAEYRAKGDRYVPLSLPARWTEDFAELLGHLVGDGNVSGNTASWIYGSEADKAELQPKHALVLRAITGEEPHVTAMSNGTLQVRMSRAPFKRFIEALGVKEARAPQKCVPWSVFQAPTPAVAAFLRGLFTADGCVVEQPNGTRYVGLSSKSKELLQGAQALLSAFGIFSRIYENERGDRSTFHYTRKDGTEVTYESSGPSYDLRLTGRSLCVFAERIGFATSVAQAKLDDIVARTEHYATDETVSLVGRGDDAVELTYNLTEPTNHSYLVNGFVVANCSEYMFLDDSACNLASFNLMKFRKPDGEFDVGAFEHATDVLITAMEIIVDNASYPTDVIGKNSYDYRPLGLGYANLGALLMAQGVSYDSERGRAICGAVTALLTGRAYRQSAELARVKQPFVGYAKNRQPFLRVIRKHRAAVDGIKHDFVPTELMDAAHRAWDEALDLGETHGYRNAQATVLAPTGTIAFMMDCDTTGIEPDIALIKYKKLVGGGLMKIVNQTVPEALRRLGYSPEQVEDTIKFIDENGSIEGAPWLKLEHLSVFDCAFRAPTGTRAIHYMGHLRMMAAAQPFISGAISKTVNVPEDITVDELSETYIQAWKLGLKAVAVYRDGCKRSQPLSTSLDSEARSSKSDGKVITHSPIRRRLPDEREAITHKFTIAGHEGYITVGKFEDGKPGELFITMSKQGSTISGLMDSFATSVSIALQYGVPLRVLVQKFIHSRFEPSGFTGNPEVPVAKSIMDYIFRWLALKFLSTDEAARAESAAEEEATPLTEQSHAPSARSVTGHFVASGTKNPDLWALQTDAPPCHHCGAITIRTGACYACTSCGETSGCG